MRPASLKMTKLKREEKKCVFSFLKLSHLSLSFFEHFFLPILSFPLYRYYINAIVLFFWVCKLYSCTRLIIHKSLLSSWKERRAWMGRKRLRPYSAHTHKIANRRKRTFPQDKCVIENSASIILNSGILYTSIHVDIESAISSWLSRIFFFLCLPFLNGLLAYWDGGGENK